MAEAMLLSIHVSHCNHSLERRVPHLVRFAGVQGFECWVSGLGSRVSGLTFRVSGFGFRVLGFGFRVSGFGFRVLGFRFRGDAIWALYPQLSGWGLGSRASFRGAHLPTPLRP